MNKKKLTVVMIIILQINILIPISMVKSNTNNDYNLLIIVPDEFESGILPLVEHKEKNQIKTIYVTLSSIYNQIGNTGRDDAEKIKYFIKSAKENLSIEYVLLIGGRKGQSYEWYLPVRYSYLYDDVFEDYDYIEKRFISDLYFADLYDKNGNFSSWDTNNNGLFGEWIGNSSEDNNLDLYPDVIIGRLPCRNIFEVKIVVEKIIQYENNDFCEEWFSKIVTVGGDSYPENYTGNIYNKSKGYEGEDVAKQIIKNMSGFTPVNLWVSTGTLKDSKCILDAVNNGCGFLYFHGHSNCKSFGTYNGPNGDYFIGNFSTNQMNFLSNGNMLPICVIHGCLSNKFDVTPLNLLDIKDLYNTLAYKTWIPECWAWKLTSKYNGGSIATVGCTGLGKTKEDKESFEMTGERIDNLFFWEYGINNTDILGDLWSNAITGYLNEHTINWSAPAASDSAFDVKTVQQWILFGDPTLKIGGYH